VITGRMQGDPTSALRGALPSPKARHHAAITDPEDLGDLLRVIEGYAGSHVVRCALQIMPHVFVRPRELRCAEWAEIDLECRSSKYFGQGPLFAKRQFWVSA
jgi:hypothetical protein